MTNCQAAGPGTANLRARNRTVGRAVGGAMGGVLMGGVLMGGVVWAVGRVTRPLRGRRLPGRTALRPDELR